MQIQLNDIGGGECLLWKIGEEEFVDDARTRHAHGALLFGGWMRCHHHAAAHAFGSHWHLWAVVETAHRLALWTLLELIRGKMQTRLDQRMIEGSILFATRHKRETRQISKHGSRAVLAVEPEEGACLWELVSREVTWNRSDALTQLLPLAPSAPFPKTPKPPLPLAPPDP